MIHVFYNSYHLIVINTNPSARADCSRYYKIISLSMDYNTEPETLASSLGCCTI